jgi:hypothetical protein
MGVHSPESCKIQSHIIPNSINMFSKWETWQIICNKSARLLYDFICKLFIFPHLYNSWVRKYFGAIPFVTLLLITCICVVKTNIIFIDNGGWFQPINPTWTFNKVHHSVKPHTFTCCFIQINDFRMIAVTKICLVDLFEKTKISLWYGIMGIWCMPSITISNHGHILIFKIEQTKISGV